MKQFIHITKENREGLASLFKVSDRTVWNAISFDKSRDSLLAKRIRKAAIERGGVLMCELPVMEALHDHDGYLRQYLPNGAMLVLSKIDGTGAVFFKGNKVKHYNRVMLNEIPNIQNWAGNLK